MGSVAIVDIGLLISGSRSLKEKRRVLRSLIALVRNRFNVSLAETGDQDMWNLASLEMAVAGTDAQYVQKVVEGVKNFILNSPDVVLNEFEMRFA